MKKYSIKPGHDYHLKIGDYVLQDCGAPEEHSHQFLNDNHVLV
jgi:hypothetical protein